jgi:hypothetical protein
MSNTSPPASRRPRRPRIEPGLLRSPQRVNSLGRTSAVSTETNKLLKMKISFVMYGISRIEDEQYRTHAWRVSLRRHGIMHVRNFADKKCGGKHKALRLARAYRDEVIE